MRAHGNILLVPEVKALPLDYRIKQVSKLGGEGHPPYITAL